MDRSELILNIRERVERARRLASYINDPRTTAALLEMAAEGEADLRRLEEGGFTTSAQNPMPPQS